MYREVLFAELVRKPAAVLKDLCGFIDLGYEPAMLEYFKRAPSRLQEHRARYRIDGTLLVSHGARLDQQSGTTRPPSAERDGVWRLEMAEEEQSRIGRAARALLEEISERAAIP
jgi:hypothetical protein